jgi:hypothetical protein
MDIDKEIGRDSGVSPPGSGGGDTAPSGRMAAGSPFEFRLDPASGVPTYLLLVHQADKAGLDEDGMLALFTSALRDFHERGGTGVRRGAAQAHLLVRARAGDPVPPGWEAHPVGLEELALAYLREPGAAALPGPARSRQAEHRR